MPMKQEQKIVLKKMVGPEFSELMLVAVSVSFIILIRGTIHGQCSTVIRKEKCWS